MRISKVIISSLATAALLLTVSAVPATAAPSPKSYKNCAELNKVYPHGVGKSGARDRTSGKPVTNFKVSNTLYSYNDGGAKRHLGERDLDRDNDGIACEKL
ncbi:excalibur calcium-binding domain-containing protein [Arthrobacter sp. PAMC25284]|uniref:excalibur calcium-binding domain-containing protein n=1 Tax=Arthrobacter sp. PAMC25284 TaxID=2861279 RepID=UPI001C635FCB|nr:excalibur calcium-binding domain-containing protein [Arthrobacter sp. PAMC25284]QYF91027.1 excalibur calcium-binding domain-containing protein [Arthrobacter sp. PAMC25284]